MTRGVVGIVAATFLSDVGHEMVTAVLPLYLVAVNLGPAALGLMEGAADLVFSLSKLAGGVAGHHTRRKRAWGAAGYLTTALGTAAIALVQSVAALASLRALAWFGRGFRSPLRDFLLADEVGARHFGRAYGIERAADMLGAVAGPAIAVLLVWLDVDLTLVIAGSLLPSLGAAAAFFFFTRDRDELEAPPAPAEAADPGDGGLPRRFWLFLGGVSLFGLGDFSRTFFIFLAAQALGETGAAAGTLSIAIVLYAVHNGVSALAAMPAGRLGDRFDKLKVLAVGYVLGAATNLALAAHAGSTVWLVAAIVASGIYFAIEETIEKAAAAEMLPRDRRSLGFGVLASANAVGDMVSSVYVGVMLARGQILLAFAVPAVCSLGGAIWIAALSRGRGAHVAAP